MYLSKPKNFALQELVDPWTYENYGKASWQFLDPTALMILQNLREQYGETTVNNWHKGGKRLYAGFRPPQCKTGSKLSLHKLGKAFDLFFKNVSACEVRHDMEDFLLDKEPFNEIGAIELNVEWFHFDVRSRTVHRVLWITP